MIGCFSGKDEETFEGRLLNLSKELTYPQDIREVAFNGLRMARHEVEGHINNHLKDIKSAAYYVLTDWRKTQLNDDIACQILKQALIKVNMLSLLRFFHTEN